MHFTGKNRFKIGAMLKKALVERKFEELKSKAKKDFSKRKKNLSK